jgi:hypothetical protein
MMLLLRKQNATDLILGEKAKQHGRCDSHKENEQINEIWETQIEELI